MEIKFEVFIENTKTGKGKWVKLPLIDFDEDLEQILDEIGATPYTWSIADVSGFPAKIVNKLKKLDLYSRNYLSNFCNTINDLVEYVNEYDPETVYAILQVANDIDEAKSLLRDGNFVFHSGVFDMEDLAYYYLEEMIPGNIWKYIEGYIDYKKFVNDMEIEGDFRHTDLGIIEIEW